MHWSVVPFGKYAGASLPEIIVRDLDWFYWAVPKLYGRLGAEAQDLARKIQTVKIPKSRGRRWQVEYRYDCDRRFCGFSFVQADDYCARWATRLPHLDLTWPLRQKRYDKRAGRIMIADFRCHYFGERKRLTRQCAPVGAPLVVRYPFRALLQNSGAASAEPSSRNPTRARKRDCSPGGVVRRKGHGRRRFSGLREQRPSKSPT
jgi:hypothetical protein